MRLSKKAETLFSQKVCAAATVHVEEIDSGHPLNYKPKSKR